MRPSAHELAAVLTSWVAFPDCPASRHTRSSHGQVPHSLGSLTVGFPDLKKEIDVLKLPLPLLLSFHLPPGQWGPHVQGAFLLCEELAELKASASMGLLSPEDLTSLPTAGQLCHGLSCVFSLPLSIEVICYRYFPICKLIA